MPKDVQARRKEEDEELNQSQTSNKWILRKASNERKKIVRSNLQSKLKRLKCKEKMERKRRTLKALDVKPTDVCKNEWE